MISATIGGINNLYFLFELSVVIKYNIIYDIKVWKVKTVIRQCTMYIVHACTYRSMSGKSTKRVEPHAHTCALSVRVCDACRSFHRKLIPATSDLQLSLHVS